jgi:NADPH-dependent 2,4-dienoyl-CoA reductase/sulfur reductase-like enzyme
VGIAESLIKSGACDMVAMTRAHIADPDIVNKFAAGNAHRVRPCVGALVCNSRKLAGYSEISCVHNPEAMREYEMAVTPTDAPKDVVVVGAGPAGLKFAEIAARRGHRVRVFDARQRTGGRLRSVERTAASDLASTVDHLTGELGELGVTVQLGVTVDAALLRDLHPDHVVIATGAESHPLDAFDGAGAVRTLSSEDALAPDAELGTDVVVYDLLGANEGALVAEALATAGRRVHLVTPYETVMPFGGISQRMETPDILRRKLAGIHTEAVIGAAGDGGVSVVRPDGSSLVELRADTVVTIAAPEPRLSVVDDAVELGLAYTVVGDAFAPRVATDAFRMGEEAALVL